MIAAAKALWEASQEKLPQARAGCCRAHRLARTANYNNYDLSVRNDPVDSFSRNFGFASATVSAAQPLYRKQNSVALDQAEVFVSQADYSLTVAQQDLILRVAIAYFDVLLAQINIEFDQTARRSRSSEQLAQAKRNFEVGVATITDTNEAQAKYDSIVAQEITTRNDYDNRVTALARDHRPVSRRT